MYRPCALRRTPTHRFLPAYEPFDLMVDQREPTSCSSAIPWGW